MKIIRVVVWLNSFNEALSNKQKLPLRLASFIANAKRTDVDSLLMQIVNMGFCRFHFFSRSCRLVFAFLNLRLFKESDVE